MYKILFTRSIDDADKEKLRAKGFEVVEHNFLAVHALPDAANIVLADIKDFKNLVFTSQHAVRIFFDVLKNHHIRLDASVKIFSTSGETKNIIQKNGFLPALSAPSAQPLAHLMVEKADLCESVYFICGNLSLPVLPDILLKNGVSLKKLVVYETVKYPLSIEPSDKAFDAVVFFSLSAADAFLVNNTLHVWTKVFTLGSTTADYVKEKTQIKSIFAADKPTIESLIETIEHTFLQTD